MANFVRVFTIICLFILRIPSVDTGPLASDCSSIMKQAGASSLFPEHAGHAVHALTVQDLKKFEPTVTENNRVPTVNRDMAASDGVLLFAPDFKSPDNDKFMTDIMKILDVVLTHMDDRMYFRFVVGVQLERWLLLEGWVL